MLLFLFSGLFFLNVNAQTDIDTDAFINRCILQVNNIDDQILYKAQIDYSGYRLGPNDYVNELLTILYFDTNSILKKLYFIFSLEASGIGYYVRYFNNIDFSLPLIESPRAIEIPRMELPQLTARDIQIKVPASPASSRDSRREKRYVCF